MSSGTLGTFVQAVGIAASFIPGIGWGIRAGIAIGTSLLGGYLKSRGNMAEEFDRGADINILGNEAPLPVIYGRTKIAPAWTDIRVDTASENDGDLWLVGALAVAGENGDGIEEVEQILLNDVIAVASPLFQPAPRTFEVTPAFEFEGTDRLAYGLHDGSDTQVLDTGLDATFAEYTADDVGRGIATLILRLTYTPEVFQGGIPRVSAVVKGNKVWDPRASSGAGAWEWSDNPALCILDYLTSKRYGLGAIYAERDGGARTEIDEDSFIAAANYCDETVSVPGAASEKRFTLNGAVDTGRPIRENMRALLTSCRGELVYEGGVFRLVIRRATTAEAVPIAQSDIIGTVEYWRAGTEQAPNRVVAHYVDEDNGWQAQEVAWPEPGATNGFLTTDNGFENTAEIQLPFTVGYHRAQRLGMVFVREQREDSGITVTVKEKAVRYQIGSVVEITLDRAGFDAAEYRVRAIALNEDSTVRLALQEYDAAAYSLDAQNTRDTLGSGGLPDASTIAPPTGVTATSNDTTAVSLGSGIRVPRIRFDWTGSVGPFLRHYEVQIRESTGPGEWRSVPDPLAGDVQTYIESVTSGDDYDIRIRAVSTIGVVSSWVTVANHTVDGEGTGPILADIQDVIGTPEDVDGLIYDASQEGWVARPITLQDLGDVALSVLPGPAAGEALMYSGSTWENRDITAEDIVAGTFTGAFTFADRVTLNGQGSPTDLRDTGFHEGFWIGRNLRYTGSGDPQTNATYIEGAGGNNQNGLAFFMKANGGDTGGYFDWYTAPTSTGASAAATLTRRMRLTASALTVDVQANFTSITLDTALGESYGGTGRSAPWGEGDMIIGTLAGGLERLLPGSEGQILKIQSGVPEWVTSSAITAANISSGEFIGTFSFQQELTLPGLELEDNAMGDPAAGITAFYSTGSALQVRFSTFPIRTILHDASSLPAANLTGTVASARLSGAYTGITGLGTLTSLALSGVATITASADTTFLSWGGGGIRKITTQGGAAIFGDSSMWLHAGDGITTLVSDRGIVAATTVEDLHLSADNHVFIYSSTQSGYATRHEWQFGSDGTTYFPGSGYITSGGVVTSMAWSGVDGTVASPAIRFASDGNTGIYRVGENSIGFATAGVQRMRVTDAGAVLTGAFDASGNVRSSVSDRRLKNRVRRITDALDRIEMLSGVTHGYTAAALKMNPALGRKVRVAGVFSQDVERALPEALDLAPFDDDGHGRSVSGEDYQTVDYDALVPLLVEGVKELRVELREVRGLVGV